MFFLFRREKEPDVPPVMRVSARHLQRQNAQQGFWDRLWDKMPFVSNQQSVVIRPVGESAEEILQDFWTTLGNFFYALRHWIPLLVLALLAGLSHWVLQGLEKEAVDKALKKITYRLPDTTMTEFVSTYMDTEGRIGRQVSALAMQHYADGRINLTRPYIVLYQKGLPYWYIWSERGEVDDKSKTYFLLGKTYFKRYNTKGELQLNVLTADVTYLPETAVAKTDAKTTIYSTLGRTDTVGMQVWLNEKKLKLNQKVRGRYEFNHKK